MRQRFVPTHFIVPVIKVIYIAVFQHRDGLTARPSYPRQPARSRAQGGAGASGRALSCRKPSRR